MVWKVIGETAISKINQIARRLFDMTTLDKEGVHPKCKSTHRTMVTRRSALPVLELIVTTRRRESRVGRITSGPDL